MRDIVSEWDATFVDIPVEELMDLVVAANFLIIQPLLEVTYHFTLLIQMIVVRRWQV